jgi:hypothetical protein
MFVAAELVRSLESDIGRLRSSAVVAAVELREGTKVEARYRGKDRYYPGVIKRVNRDGTYDVDYDDVSYGCHA